MMTANTTGFVNLERHSDNTAVIDAAGNSLSYRALAELVNAYQQRLLLLALQQGDESSRLLVFILASSTLTSLIAYLACLRGGHVPLLLDAGIKPEALEGLIENYQPNAMIDGSKAVADSLTVLSSQLCKLHAELALLLSTSGSTGSPKLVRLSFANLQSNAQSIIEYLPIRHSDTAITSLPFCYSYGLSVINTHLLQGARIALTESSLHSREFWQLMAAADVSSFSGVPLSFSVLQSMRFERQSLPSLRYITCAGGKLNRTQWQYLIALSHDKQLPVYAMYGQTEATARMAYLPPQAFERCFGAIGEAIPGGRLLLRDSAGDVIKNEAETGELIYQGSNVMLGYAENRTQLALGAVLNELSTGDLAQRQGNYYFIQGRLKRFVKVAGLRINLDEVESYCSRQGIEARAAGGDDALQVALQVEDSTQQIAADQSAIQAMLADYLQINPRYIAIKRVPSFPLLASGKIDYVGIARLFQDAA